MLAVVNLAFWMLESARSIALWQLPGRHLFAHIVHYRHLPACADDFNRHRGLVTSCSACARRRYVSAVARQDWNKVVGTECVCSSRLYFRGWQWATHATN